MTSTTIGANYRLAHKGAGVKLISFEDISNLNISPSQCCKWINAALKIKATSTLPKKISLSVEGMQNVFYNTMPSLLPDINRGCVKLVTRYPERVPALDSEILLYDLETGSCLALMDGDWITTMRTGAVAAHSIRLLAKPSFAHVGIMGLGNTARATMLCLQSIFSERPLQIGLLVYKDQHLSFAERFKAYDNLSFNFFESVEELAAWSDVFVSCVTAADSDFCSPDCFMPGTLLVPVHTRGFAQCDLVFDKVFADDIAHVSGFRYFESFKDRLTEVADVVGGVKPGRESDDERILAYNIGISLHDTYFASMIYQLAADETRTIDLRKPLRKIWV